MKTLKLFLRIQQCLKVYIGRIGFEVITSTFSRCVEDFVFCGQSKSGDPNILLYSVPKLERKSYIEEETSVALINEILKTKFCLKKGNIDVIRILNRCIIDVCIPNSKTAYHFQYTSMNFVVHSQDGIAVKISGFPPIQKNFICNLDTLDVVNQFLERYFMVYDSNNRRMIQELYHKNAMFSMNTQYLYGQLSSATSRLYKYVTSSRNLNKLADFSLHSKNLFQGSTIITNTLCSLPATEHDPFSFTVDLMYSTPRCAVIGVSGVFKESPESLLDSEKFYGFRRTFALEIVNGDGLCYIVNEQLHVHNALSFQVLTSFKHAKAVVPTQMRLPQTDKEQQQVVDTMRIITNMNTDWSRKCLEECHYDLKKALTLFVDLYKADKIPRNALVEK